MKGIRISVNDSYVVVSIQNGATRETSGRTLPEVIAALPAEDRETVATFCRGLLASLPVPATVTTEDTAFVKGALQLRDRLWHGKAAR